MNIFIQTSTNVSLLFSLELENRKTSPCSPRAPIPDGRMAQIMQPWYTSQYFCSARITLPPHMTASHEQLDPNCKLRTTNHERQITNGRVISLPIQSDHNLIYRKSSRDSIPIDLERICGHPGIYSHSYRGY